MEFPFPEFSTEPAELGLLGRREDGDLPQDARDVSGEERPDHAPPRVCQVGGDHPPVAAAALTPY
jgi:hypothetical protein